MQFTTSPLRMRPCWVCQVWLVVQRKWMYLESIFVGNEDMRAQLPAQAKRFDGVDAAWARIMADTVKAPHVLSSCSVDGRCAGGKAWLTRGVCKSHSRGRTGTDLCRGVMCSRHMQACRCGDGCQIG